MSGVTRVSWVRTCLYAIGLYAIGLLGVAAVCAAPSAEPKPASTTRAAQLEDLRVFRSDYLAKDMAFSPAARKLAEAGVDRMEKLTGTLSPLEFQLSLAQISALADNAHSGARFVNPTSRLPLRLLWFPDALVIARATGPAADLAGARVLKIEGRAPLALFENAKVLLGGSEAGRQHWLNQWIESDGVLHALGLAAAPHAVRFKLQLADGRTVERTVPMLPVSESSPTGALERLWSPEPLAAERDWRTALRTDSLPLYLRDANKFFRAIPLPSLQALYVQFRSNEDEEGFPIAAFLDDVRRQIAESAPTNLIVDLRFDVGGNILTTLDFTRKLPESVRGRTYLLVGPYTFSAGIISAAAIKKHGTRVTVVGDEIGDRLHFWSEGDNAKLPNSQYSFRYTNGQFNLLDGCTGEPGCMDDQYHVDVNFASLTAELHAPLTAAAYFAGRDPAMEAITADIANRKSVDKP